MESQEPSPMRAVSEKYRYASTYGLYIGLYIGLFYLLSALFPHSGVVKALCSIGNLGALVVAWYFIRKYRDEVLGGYARFGWMWSFSFWTAVFAAIITAAIHFVHFQWIQPDFISDTFNQALNLLEQMDYPEEQMDAIADFGVPSAVQLTFMYFWFEVMGGILLAVVYGLLLQKRDAFGECPTKEQSDEPSDTTHEGNDNQMNV